ncbi:MAG: hypothetical protein FIB06_01640 [Betaproteobacteria bacterium]|nr:hypothetical protein [Betaproteobacteria bacterium]
MANVKCNTQAATFYATLPIPEVLARAIEMATEIRDDASISCNIALSLEELTANPDNQQAGHIVAGALADRMALRSQNQRLLDCLYVLAEKIGARAEVDAMLPETGELA